MPGPVLRRQPGLTLSCGRRARPTRQRQLLPAEPNTARPRSAWLALVSQVPGPLLRRQPGLGTAPRAERTTARAAATTHFYLPAPACRPRSPIPGSRPTATVGNSTNAHLDAAGPSLTGTVQGGVLTFNPANATGDDQKVLNIFYYCCYMHDFSYLLGFREAVSQLPDGRLRPGRYGWRSAWMPAPFRVPCSGTANMSRSVDGHQPHHEHGHGDLHQPPHRLRLDRRLPRVHARHLQPPGRRRYEHEQPLTRRRAAAWAKAGATTSPARSTT